MTLAVWESQVSTLYCHICSVRHIFEYICRLYCQCHPSLAPAVLMYRLFFLSTSNFSLDQTRVFSCHSETSATPTPRFLHFHRVFHLLNWPDILSSCSVSTHLKALSGLSECLLANVSLFLSAQSPRSPDTESTSCRVSTAHGVWHRENFQILIFNSAHTQRAARIRLQPFDVYILKCRERVGEEKLHWKIYILFKTVHLSGVP